MLALWMTTALAGAVIEAPPFSDRKEATALSKSVDVDGKSKVVRRFKEGEGWEYTVRWTFADPEAAFAAAGTIAKAAGEEVVVRDDAGKAIEAPAPAPAPDPEPAEAPRDWLGEAEEIHGSAMTELSEAQTVRVTFVRAFEGGEARHVFIRRGTDLALKIDKVKGDVQPSITIAAGEAAWLQTGGKTSREDLQRTRERLETFSLHALAPVVLELDRATKSHPELAELHPKGSTKVGDTVCDVAATADEGTLLAFGPDGFIRRVSLGQHARVYTFSDYKSVGEAMIPHEIVTVVDGKERDSTRIEKVEFDVEIDGRLFEPPP